MTERTLARAREGSEEAFRELTDPYRAELQLHCYRILGSVQDAEDSLQETLLAAWRGLEGFEGRASGRSWLYRTATNRCLNALRERKRRPERSAREPRPLSPGFPPPTRLAETLWLEPYPDVLLEGIAERGAEPDARYEAKEAVGLAFVTALARLPPRQRAVLGFSSEEAAGMLESSSASVNSALLRAREAVEARLGPGQRERAPLPRSAQERALVDRFARAFESGDVDGVVELLTADAWLTMPPERFEFQGPQAIAEFFRTVPRLQHAPYRLVPTRANAQPAFGCYLADAQARVARAHGLLVLTLEGGRISTITRFLDNGVLAHFGLPPTLPQ